jgi:hypothetical protein
MINSSYVKVTQAEKMARDKEERYAQEQKDNIRRQELTETLKTNGTLILKVRSQVFIWSYFLLTIFIQTSFSF